MGDVFLTRGDMHAGGPRIGGSDLAGLRIGLLGGSFKPPHGGHLHITRLALKRLRLHQAWWVVSPQNPLKEAAGMAPLAERLAGARALARGEPRIRVTDVEARLGTRYTADTLRALVRACPRTRFVWLMGADNLGQIPRWEKWPEIFATVPIAVFDRATYSFGALASKAAHRFRRYRVPDRHAPGLASMEPPAWVYLHTPLHPASSTELRGRMKGGTEGCRRFGSDRGKRRGS